MSEKKSTLLKSIRLQMLEKFGKEAVELINAQIYLLSNQRSQILPEVGETK